MDNLIDRYYPYLLGLILFALSLALRLWAYPVVTADYTESLSHWMDALEGSSGLTAFANPFSNYAPLYLYFLKLLTFIPIYDLYTIKTLSLLFDVVNAVLIAYVVRDFSPKKYTKSELFLIGNIAFIVPTFLLNSSLWAQSDSIYTTFVLLTLWFALKDKPLAAVIWFGIAFCFKLQSIFFLPFLIGYLIGRRHSIFYILIIPAIFFISIIPAWASGGDFWQLFGIYLSQSSEFDSLTLSAPTIYSFLNNWQFSAFSAKIISYIGVLLAIAASYFIVVASARVFVRNGKNKAEKIVFLALICVLLVPFLLPHMHERYFYMADAIALIYGAFDPKRWWVPVIVIAASFLSYMSFLSGAVPFYGRLIIDIGYIGFVVLVLIITMVPRFIGLMRQPVIIVKNERQQ